jgi:hypothetical protein
MFNTLIHGEIGLLTYYFLHQAKELVCNCMRWKCGVIWGVIKIVVHVLIHRIFGKKRPGRK